MGESSKMPGSLLESASLEGGAIAPGKLSILMWACNQEQSIARAVGEVLAIDRWYDIELIVVDDGSTDATLALLTSIDDPRLIVHRHRAKLGRGASILTAVSLASGTHVVPFDASLEYSADDIVRLAKPVFDARCDVVYGTRMSGYNIVYQSYRHALGNRLLTGVMNVLFNSCLSDLRTCLKLVPLDLVRSFDLSEAGFGLDIELTAMLLRTGERPFEVPVSYYSHPRGGARNQWREAFSCLGILFRVRLSRSRRSRVPAHSALARPSVVGRISARARPGLA
jgi:glycosyltransferase involved in cell wall biosynthesis